MNEVIAFHNTVDNLKSDINLLKNELDDKNQLVYDYKKQLAVALALEKDYQQEIEALQSNKSAEVKILKEKITELEANATKLKNNSNSELLQKSEIIDDLKNQISEFSKIGKNNRKNGSSDDSQYNIERNVELKDERSALTNKLIEIESNASYLQIQNVSLEQTNDILNNELKDKQQYFTYKSQELTSAKNKLQNLQEDIFLIKLELESIKSKPLDACSKGNSLFAEVEDSCQKIQQNLEQTKKTYSRLKQDVTTKIKQLSIMRTQNIELCAKLNMVNSSNEEYDKIIKKYKAKVREWESIIDKYKRETSKQPKFHGNDLAQYAVEFANNTISTKWASEMRLLETLDNESKKKLETYTEIEHVNNEMRRWRRIAQQLKVKSEKLENLISEIQLYNTLGATNDLEECFNIIQQELSEINPNTNNIIDDILKCETKVTQNASSVENNKSVDTLCDEFLGLSTTVIKSNNSLENFYDMESNLTDITEIENTFAEKLSIKDNNYMFNVLTIKDEIKNESIDISSHQVKVESEINDQEDTSNGLENNPLEDLKTDIPENDISTENESIIEIESTFNETNTTEEHSLALVKVENQSTIEDSSVEIIGEFKITQGENVELTQYDDNRFIIKNEDLEDNDSVEIIAEYKNPQSENSLNNIELLSCSENDPPLSKQETGAIDSVDCNIQAATELVHSQKENLDNNVKSIHFKEENLVLTGAKQCSMANAQNTFEIPVGSNNIQTENKLANSQKENLPNNTQGKQNSKSYSTPITKSVSDIKSGSESKINSNTIRPHNSIQKQNSLSNIKSKQCVKNYSTLTVHQKCATAVKSVPNVVSTKKYVSQSEKKVFKSTTVSSSIPARKKLL